jgi:ornithine cyclodeaminase
MPAWGLRAIVVKLVTVMPQAAATVMATVLVLDRGSGEPLALLDGEALTLRRTAATSALAARHLARAEAESLLIVGTGRLAPWMARAHAAGRPGLRRIMVWGRDAGAAAALARTLADDDLPATPAPDLEAAVRQAHIISCATTSTVPLLQGAWLAPGTHLDLVGGFRPDMREADNAAIAACHVVVDSFAGALAEAGDLTQPLGVGAITREHVTAELAQVLCGDRPGRSNGNQCTLFKSVGTALEDLAAAELVVFGRAAAAT